MTYFSIPDNVTTTQNPPDIKKNETTTAETFGFAITIIFGVVGLVVAGIGLAGCMRALSGLNQVNSIIMVASGGVGGIVLLAVGIVGTVKTQAQKKAEGEKSIKKAETPKENDLVNKAKEEAEKAKKLEKEKAKEAALARKLAKATESQKAKEEAEKAKKLEKEKAKEEADKAKELEKAKKAKAKEEAEKAKELEKAKAKEKEEAEKAKELEKATLAKSVQHLFSDCQSALFDGTADKLVRVRLFDEHCPLAVTGGPNHDVILLGKTMVLFTKNLAQVLFFSKAQNTEHVLVEDEGRPGVYKFKEKQVKGPDNLWIVDTNKKFRIETKDNTGRTEITPVYLIESEIPQDYDSAAQGTVFHQHASGSIRRTLKKGS